MQDIWCLGSDRITREVHPTEQIVVGVETVGQFTTQYFSENGRIIPVSRQTSVNISVELLGILADAWGCGFQFLENALVVTVPRGWGDNDTSNQNWPVIPGGPYENVSVTWSGAVSDRPAYMPRSPENARAAARRIHDNYLCIRRRERMRSPSTSCKPIRNRRVNCCGYDWEGPADQ